MEIFGRRRATPEELAQGEKEMREEQERLKKERMSEFLDLWKKKSHARGTGTRREGDERRTGKIEEGKDEWVLRAAGCCSGSLFGLWRETSSDDWRSRRRRINGKDSTRAECPSGTAEGKRGCRGDFRTEAEGSWGCLSRTSSAFVRWSPVEETERVRSTSSAPMEKGTGATKAYLDGRRRKAPTGVGAESRFLEAATDEEPVAERWGEAALGQEGSRAWRTKREAAEELWA